MKELYNGMGEYVRLQQKFLRYENRYMVDAETRVELENVLKFYMNLDPNVREERHNRYFVRSLYFDDDLYTNSYEGSDRHAARRKYRIRTYTDSINEESPVFLEVKGRSKERAYKRRVELPRTIIRALEYGGCTFRGEFVKLAHIDPLFSSFNFDVQRMNLRPRLLVDYERRPYISDYLSDFRITFDSALELIVTDRLFDSTADCQRLFMPGYSVMEIKFKVKMPAWFARLIGSFDLKPVADSKYYKGMERTGLACKLVDNFETGRDVRSLRSR